MSYLDLNPYKLGEIVTLTADLTDPSLVPEDASSLTWLVRDPTGVEADRSSSVQNPSEGVYTLDVTADTQGVWSWRLITDGNVAVAEDSFPVNDEYATVPDPTAPTDLRVLVPRVRRYCEGPYGPPQGKPALSELQLYEMAADALSEIILYAGHQFPRRLIVTQRDARVGFPTGWATDKTLDEWESTLITTQAALNYYFFVFRDMRTSLSIKNEGTEYSYTLSANVLRDFIANLQSARDLGLKGMMKHNPVLDQVASNIRVRDQATVAILEWWDTNSADAFNGLPGGQEAAVIPWTPGWSGPGFTQGY